ncbi:MAG: asparaginase [Lachnospiraceae bacterium]|nr:asparaginase [Lachnospiraceae bacterium]
MYNIAVIITGGTIASDKQDNYISLNNTKSRYKILELFSQKYPERNSEIRFDISSPYTILSENLSGNHINTLIKNVKEILSNEKKYDGVIITHGTDTLQYSAAALAICLSDIKIPVMLVSSNYILDDNRANGLMNFAQAVEYITACDMSGIYVSYDGSILDGFTLLPHIPYSDKIYALGQSDDLSKEKPKKYLMPEDLSFDDITLTNTSPILYLRAVPGQIFPKLDGTDIKAVLLETYHSGTLGTDSRELREFCENACLYKIPIYVVGVKERTQYESTSLYTSLNLKVMPKISPIAAYMFLWFKYSN